MTAPGIKLKEWASDSDSEEDEDSNSVDHSSKRSSVHSSRKSAKRSSDASTGPIEIRKVDREKVR